MWRRIASHAVAVSLAFLAGAAAAFTFHCAFSPGVLVPSGVRAACATSAWDAAVADRYAYAHQPEARERIAVVGETGTGKSHFARAYWRNIRRLAVADLLSETELGGDVLTADEFAQSAARNGMRSGVLRVVIRPLAHEWDDPAEWLNRISEGCERVGDLTLGVEEIGNVLPDGPAPSQTPPAFRRLVTSGRHQGVSLVVVGQSFVQVPTVYRTNASRIVAFAQPDPDAASALSRRMARKVSAQAFMDLPDRHYIDWTRGDPRGPVHCSPLPAEESPR